MSSEEQPTIADLLPRKVRRWTYAIAGTVIPTLLIVGALAGGLFATVVSVVAAAVTFAGFGVAAKHTPAARS